MAMIAMTIVVEKFVLLAIEKNKNAIEEKMFYGEIIRKGGCSRDVRSDECGNENNRNGNSNGGDVANENTGG